MPSIRILIGTVTLVALSLSSLKVIAADAPSSLVLYNATVYTANDSNPKAEAVIAENGVITFVGSSAEALKRSPANARRIDLAGKTVLPGLTDAHAHLAGIGFRELEFNLEGTPSLTDLQKRLRERATQTKAGDWLTGRGWIESRWSPATFPTRKDLDAIVTDRAVVLTRADGHALVANSLALKRAGIDRNTKDPAGGTILRDDAGEPIGMLVDEAIPCCSTTLLGTTSRSARKARRGWRSKRRRSSHIWISSSAICRRATTRPLASAG